MMAVLVILPMIDFVRRWPVNVSRYVVVAAVICGKKRAEKHSYAYTLFLLLHIIIHTYPFFSL